MESVLRVGDFVAGYNIVRKLGDGARAQVYQVVKAATGQTFALKRVIREHHEDDRFLLQAISEFENSTRFDHPYLRKSYELFRTRKLFKLVEVQVILEYVDGLTLDVMRPTSIAKTIDIFKKVAQGLHAMHEAGFLHTDIKPNNILLPPDSSIKIIDFGQSCPIGFRKPRIQGTPDYIAPEQVERRALSRQTDVFNLGATLYWALTGQTFPTLITKKDRHSVAEAPRQGVIPAPVELNPEAPLPLSRLVMQCCAFDRVQRPRDMTEVIGRLEMVEALLAKGAASSDADNASVILSDLPPEDLSSSDTDLHIDFSALSEFVEKPEDRDKRGKKS